MEGTCSEHTGCLADIRNLKNENQAQWSAMKEIRETIEKMRNHLPPWATFTIAVLMSISTGLAVYFLTRGQG